MVSTDSDEAPPSRTTSLSPDPAGNIQHVTYGEDLKSQGWDVKKRTRSSSLSTSSESSDEYVMPILPDVKIGLRRRESMMKKKK